MKAEIISIGSSLLKGLVENKNAAFIARKFLFNLIRILTERE